MLEEARSDPEQSVVKQAYAKGLEGYLSIAVPIDRKVSRVEGCYFDG